VEKRKGGFEKKRWGAAHVKQKTGRKSGWGETEKEQGPDVDLNYWGGRVPPAKWKGGRDKGLLINAGTTKCDEYYEMWEIYASQSLSFRGGAQDDSNTFVKMKNLGILGDNNEKKNEIDQRTAESALGIQGNPNLGAFD